MTRESYQMQVVFMDSETGAVLATQKFNEPAKRKCNHCDDDVNVLIPPVHWPIGTVALACYACGRVRRYEDNLYLFTPRKAVVEFQAKPWAVRNGVAIQPSNFEVARELVLLGIENGLSVSEISTNLDVEEHYVRNIARAAGLGS